jgi:hypothetical protein
MRLPNPDRLGDAGHQYLAAIYEELQTINGRLEKIAAQKGSQEPGEGELIVLREPAMEPVESTPLPDSFPGRAALLAAGFDSLESVPKTGAALTAVSGIGTTTANQILTWFKVNG